MTSNDKAADNEFASRVEHFFAGARHACSSAQTSSGDRILVFFDELRRELAGARSEIEQYERAHASRFNVFDYIEPDENRLSDILANLLDPRGTHGQGDLFLRLFLKQCGRTLQEELRSAKVFREGATTYLANDRRRIDIRVDFATFGIGIENKPWALEQENQLRDYYVDLDKQYGGRFLLLYLSGTGERPTSATVKEQEQWSQRGQFCFWTFREDLTQWLAECEATSQSPRIQGFLNDFLAYLSRRFQT